MFRPFHLALRRIAYIKKNTRSLWASHWPSGQRDGLRVHGSSALSLNPCTATVTSISTFPPDTVAARPLPCLLMFHAQIKSLCGPGQGKGKKRQPPPFYKKI